MAMIIFELCAKSIQVSEGLCFGADGLKRSEVHQGGGTTYWAFCNNRRTWKE